MRRSDFAAHIARTFDLPPDLIGADVAARRDAAEPVEPEPVEQRSSYEHIFRYVSTAAWALEPQVLAVLKDMIAYRMQGHRLDAGELADRIGGPGKAAENAARGNAVRRRGAVALMSLYGVVAPRASMVNSVSGPSGTGLDAFSRSLDQAVSDPDVSSIVIDVNSPGGSVDMVPETAARLRRARDQKPVYAIANTDAASAAYWLGSQTTELWSTPSGQVGSIGVYSAHQDMSVAQEMEGKRVTLISAGKFKVEGNPFEALGEEARAAIQSQVDGYYDWFVNDVAQGRDVKSSSVRAGYGEGRMLMSKDALAEGMIDKVGTIDELVTYAMNGGRRSRSGAASSAEGVTVSGAELVLDGETEHFEYVDL